MTRKLFGTDGIRGIANTYPMTPEVALNVGRAVAYLFKRNSHKAKIIIGKDTRISCYMLEQAIASGICAMGGDAYLIGPLSTPGVAFMAQSQRADAAIVISASHNPYQDNGIKIFSGQGFKLPDETEQEIEDIILNNLLEKQIPEAGKLGKAYRIDDAEGRYIVFLKNTFPRDLSMEGMKIVLDCAHGATYKVAPHVFWELGAEVHTINAAPDGLNINDACGSQYIDDLAETVRRTGAQLGMAFDGDGDRLIGVDEKGSAVTGDRLIGICARTLQKENRLKNNIVVTTVMSNKGLCTFLKESGIHHVITQVGDRYVLEEMQRREAILGGEDSGHIIFLNHHTAGDGILTGLQLIASMLKEQKPLSELASRISVYPQVLLNLEVSKKPDLTAIPAVRDAIAQCEQELGEKGRVLVRYSGTQQICRVMVEGPDKNQTQSFCNTIAETIKQHTG